MSADQDWKDLQEAQRRMWWRRVTAAWATCVLVVVLYGIVLGFRWCATPHCEPSTRVLTTEQFHDSQSCDEHARMETETTNGTTVVRCVCPR